MTIEQILILVGIGIVALIIILMFAWRVVVPTNQYHIVQRSNSTIEYGKGKAAGNVYYNIPSFVPVLGITRIVMPAIIFDITITKYEAFDKGRVPFYVDIAGFFRIENSAAASQRISSIEELHAQLESIVASIARTILGKMDINEILESRTELGDQFMQEVSENIKEFGLVCTKNIELMKVYDVENGTIIYNIQKKKESEIEKDAKVSIEENRKLAEKARIDADKLIALEEANKTREVGEKEAEARRTVEVSRQQAEQAIKEEQKSTLEREMEIQKVAEIQAAEIEKSKKIIQENQEKEIRIIKAEAEAKEIEALAEGRKNAADNDAKAIKTKAEAEADAIKKKALAEAEGAAKKQEATIADQLALLKEISTNSSYAQYLKDVKAIEMYGKAEQLKAEALKSADIKYLAVGEENKYGEFLGKLGLGIETFKSLDGVANVQDIISNIVKPFKKEEKENSTSTTEQVVSTDEVIDADEEAKQSKRKNKNA